MELKNIRVKLLYHSLKRQTLPITQQGISSNFFVIFISLVSVNNLAIRRMHNYNRQGGKLGNKRIFSPLHRANELLNKNMRVIHIGNVELLTDVLTAAKFLIMLTSLGRLTNNK